RAAARDFQPARARIVDVDVVDLRVDPAQAGEQPDAGGHAGDPRIADIDVGAGALVDVDAARGESRDRHIVDRQVKPGDEAYSIRSGSEALNVQIAQHDLVVGARVDSDPGDSVGQNAADGAAAVDRDRLVDREGAEPARIDAVDLAAGPCLRQRRGKGRAG